MKRKTQRLKNPLIVQANRTILVETHHSASSEICQRLQTFAERIKRPAYLHTYRMTRFSLWNAAQSGETAKSILEWLDEHSKMSLPASLKQEIQQIMGCYGIVRLESADTDSFQLVSEKEEVYEHLLQHAELRPWLLSPPGQTPFLFSHQQRGWVKQACFNAGYPVRDLLGYEAGEDCPVQLKKGFRVRDYQLEAVEAFYQQGSVYGGNGVVVLPCGAGKTVVGIAAMAKMGKATLILTPNATSAKQWIREILDKTDLSPQLVGEYTAAAKQVRPVTVTTYQMLTYRSDKEGDFAHLHLFSERDWGLIIYDEVHLLPAPVFRMTADLQAKRRLGLSATLIREDGREGEVFSLIGPKLYELSWKELESQGWIQKAACLEIRVPFSAKDRASYQQANQRQKYRLAAVNPAKIEVLNHLLKQHHREQILIIGQYLEQLKQIAVYTGAPLITGEMKQSQREEWFARFRAKEISLLVVSKVANFAVDLPDASVAIQVSGTYGSRQEEAQRLGRILRPKQTGNLAYFYHVVTADSLDQEMAWNRQLFLAEQGYRYEIKELEGVRDA